MDLIHDFRVEVSPVPKEECHLHENKERGRYQSLVKRIEEGGGSALKHSMANELQNPSGDVDSEGHLKR